MATVYQQLRPGEALVLASAFPQYTKINGSNYPIEALAYDAASDEAAFWVFRATDYGSGNLTIDIEWYADTANSGNVIFDAQIACLTPNTDDVNIEADGLATANSVTDSHLGGTNAQRLHRATITLSNLDSIAADDYCTLRLARDADNASDTMSGDALVVLVTVSYSDT